MVSIPDILAVADAIKKALERHKNAEAEERERLAKLCDTIAERLEYGLDTFRQNLHHNIGMVVRPRIGVTYELEFYIGVLPKRFSNIGRHVIFEIGKLERAAVSLDKLEYRFAEFSNAVKLSSLFSRGTEDLLSSQLLEPIDDRRLKREIARKSRGEIDRVHELTAFAEKHTLLIEEMNNCIEDITKAIGHFRGVANWIRNGLQEPS